MTIEEKLKDYILMRYKSIREFTQVADIPYTTIDSIFKRGIDKSSISNILKICKVLNLSVDALADGELKPRGADRIPAPTTDIRDVVNDAKTRVYTSQRLTIDGNDIDIEHAEPILNALDIAYEMTRKHNKNITKTAKKPVDFVD
jgi:hypothetical protein